MPSIAAYLTPEGYKICPVCAHLHWDEEFKPLFSTDISDYNCSVCKDFVRVVPIWGDAPFYEGGYAWPFKTTACILAAIGIVSLILYYILKGV